jgi:hypothetical protein
MVIVVIWELGTWTKMPVGGGVRKYRTGTSKRSGEGDQIVSGELRHAIAGDRPLGVGDHGLGPCFAGHR